MSMTTKVGRILPWAASTCKFTEPYDQVVLRDHVTN